MINKRFYALFFVVLIISGCNGFKAWFAREFKQEELSSGIARLSVQHLSMITSEVSKKFKDPQLSTIIEKDRDPQNYGKGSVTKTIESFDIDYQDEQVVYEDCLGDKALWTGKVHVIKATQTIYGRLTNNPENPVIPDPNQVKMTIYAAPDNARIKFSNQDAFLELRNGELSFEAYPRLAQAQKGSLQGLRVVPTSNSRFENVVFNNVHGMLFSSKVNLPFDVSDSRYNVQVGEGENGEANKIYGQITAFANTRTIAADNNKLVPDYDAAAFMKTYSCKEELSGVVTYKNVLLEEKIGPGMAALTTLAMSKIAGKFADDYDCGMSSPAFLRETLLTGDPGGKGQAQNQLSLGCRISFTKYQTEPDCLGIAYEINGEALVTSAQKTIRGVVIYPKAYFMTLVTNYENLLTNNDIEGALAIKPEPIIPISRQPADITITADLSNLTIKEICVAQGSIDHSGHCHKNQHYQGLEFVMASGQVSAMLKPMMAKGIDPADNRVLNICAVRNLPIAEADLVLNDVNASIKKSGNELKIRAKGLYQAISGRIGNRENELSGELAIGKVSVPFKEQHRPYIALKPDYDAQLFIDSFQSCKQNKFILPVSDDDCQI